jgi:hypothetical protein
MIFDWIDRTVFIILLKNKEELIMIKLIYDIYGSDEENEYYEVCNEYGKIYSTPEGYSQGENVYIDVDHIRKVIEVVNLWNDKDKYLIKDIEILIKELSTELNIQDYKFQVL